MTFFTLKQRIFIVKMFYLSGRSTENVQKEFMKEFHEFQTLPSANIIIELVNLFEEYGNVIAVDAKCKSELSNNLNEQDEFEIPVNIDIKIPFENELVSQETETIMEKLNEASNSEIEEESGGSGQYQHLQNITSAEEQEILQFNKNTTKDSKVKLSLKCEVCDKTFNRHARYDRHMNAHKNTCPICRKRVRDIEVHMRRHTGEKSFQCSQCGKQFHRYDRLRCHMVSHSEERPFSCEICSKSFKTRKHLQEHTKTHLSIEDRPIFCKVCGKRFLYNVDLKKHNKIHTGEKPSLCIICGKHFASNDILKIHKRIHTGEKPYQCPYCDRQFSRCGSFHSHKRIHTGEKPFKCSFCEKTFYDSGSCRSHEHVHIVDYPYKCLQCVKAYNHLSSLKSHIKYTHREAHSS